MEPSYTPYNPETGSAQRIIPAMVLIGIGALFLLNNLHILYFNEIVRYWPVILIAAGIVKMVDSAHQGGRIGGGIMLVIGAVFLAKNMGFLFVSVGALWPLVLIGVGVLMLYNRMWQGPRPGPQNATYVDVDRVSEHPVFSGSKRNILSQNFKGGEVGAVFGGIELDLRNADFPGPSVTIETDAVFGGIEIRVPRHWSTVVQVSAIFGGVNDQTTQPDPVHYPNPKQVIVKGSAVFGGVDIKN